MPPKKVGALSVTVFMFIPQISVILVSINSTFCQGYQEPTKTLLGETCTQPVVRTSNYNSVSIKQWNMVIKWVSVLRSYSWKKCTAALPPGFAVHTPEPSAERQIQLAVISVSCWLRKHGAQLLHNERRINVTCLCGIICSSVVLHWPRVIFVFNLTTLPGYIINLT